jgi:hypothetical protein
VLVGGSCLVDQILPRWTCGTIHDCGAVIILVEPSSTGCTNVNSGSKSGTRLAVKALAEIVVFREGGGVVQKVASSGALDTGREGAWLIGIRSTGANGAGVFSGVGVGTDGAVGALREEEATGFIGVGATGATFASGVGGQAEFVGVSAGGAGFAGGLGRLVGEASGGATFTGSVVLESAGGATAGGGGGGGGAVHAGGGGCVADVGTADAGGGVGGGAVGDVAGGEPSGIGGGLAFVFGKVADEAGPICAR